MKLELYINGKLADIKDDSIIAITKTYESVENPTNYYADFSKTVSLPVTKRNNDIFSNFNRLDSLVTDQSIDPLKRIPFVLLDNKELIMQGYLHLDNANTIYTDQKYDVTLYSSLGYIINEMKMLTFNPYVYASDDPNYKYFIETPFNPSTTTVNKLKINRNLVKRSFEQQTHSFDSDDIIDWIGFIPTYQGKYNDFSSDKEQVLKSGRTDDMSQERDEHYMREFRSYCQQPFFWVDKLWKSAKDKIESITDYTINLDPSWFSPNNPYYRDLILTCPTLMENDDNYKEYTESFKAFPHQSAVNIIKATQTNQSDLTTHYLKPLNGLVKNSGDTIYDNNVFNPNKNYGSSLVKGRLKFTLFAANNVQLGNGYAKIQEDNPFYVTVKAVTKDNMNVYRQDIAGAKKTFLLYSCSHNASASTYDEAIDLGVTSRSDPSVTVPVINREVLNGAYAGSHHQTFDGYFWEGDLDFAINVQDNLDYKIVVDVYNANTHKPFEYAIAEWIPNWDWLWTDLFYTGNQAYGDKGYSYYVDVMALEVITQQNLRSNSELSLYRVFSKDTSLCDVLLNYSKIFGLVWTVDEENKVLNITSRNRFFADRTILDWTDRIDRSKEFKFSPVGFDKRYVDFNYEEGDCGVLKKYESKYEYSYGAKVLDTGYEFNSEHNELYKGLEPSVISQKRQFSCMINTEYEDRPGFMGYNYMVYPNEHYVDNDDNGSNAGMSGAFYFRNGTFAPDPKLSRKDTNGNYCIWITDDTEHQIQAQSYCWNACGENVVLCYALPDVSTISNTYNDKKYSIHFASPKDYYFKVSTSGVNYVYPKFWENYINERYCSQNKKLTAYVYITPEEFAAIDFSQFIKIDNLLYIINKVYDYNFNTLQPVKMDLVQVWDMTAYTTGQFEFPYIYTASESAVIDTTFQDIPVYSSGAWTVASQPSWVSCANDNGKLKICATGTTTTYREGEVTLSLTGTTNTCTLLVKQNAMAMYINVMPKTLLFPATGGTQAVTVNTNAELSDLEYAFGTGLSSPTWVSGEFYEAVFTTRRDAGNYTFNVTVEPNTLTQARNTVLTIGFAVGGVAYSKTVNIGQQAAANFSREYDINLSELDVYDSNNQLVQQLTAGETYHFQEYFPEQILVDSIHITNGTATVSGNSGLQTVTFTPLLSNVDLTDANPIGGGMIVIQTVNGGRRVYNYTVHPSVQPIYSRNITVSSPNNGSFTIKINSGREQTMTYYSNNLPDGTTVEITALPDTGYTFQNWTLNGTTPYGTNPLTFTVSADAAYTANFQQVAALVTLTLDPSSNGKVKFAGDANYSTVPISKTVASGSLVGIQAEPNSGYTFTQWSDGITNATRIVTVNSTTTLTASFAQVVNYNVSISAGNNGSVSVNGVTGNYSATVANGTQLIIAATANNGYTFNGWSDGNNNANRTITVTGNVTLTASFAQAVVQHSIRLDATDGMCDLRCEVDGNAMTPAQAGSVSREDFDEGTYNITVEAVYDDSSLNFNSIVLTNGNNIQSEYRNPATFTYNLDSDITIYATLLKQDYYYAFYDYSNDLLVDQDIMVAGRLTEISDTGQTQIDIRLTGNETKFTFVTPKQYIVNSIKGDVTGVFRPDMDNQSTANGLWWVTMISDVESGRNTKLSIELTTV